MIRLRDIGVDLVVAILLGTAASGEALSVGDKPRIDMRTLDGEILDSQNLAGRITIFEFWATWCGPCIRELPHLKKIHETYKEQGVVLISVNRDESEGAATRFITKNKMDWIHVHDPSQKLQYASVWGVRAIPHAFILSPEGEVLWRGHPAGMDQPLSDALKLHPPRISDRAEDAIDLVTAPRPIVSMQAPRIRIHANILKGKVRRAQRAHDSHDFYQAYRICNWINDRVSGGDEAQWARDWIGKYESNPSIMEQVGRQRTADEVRRMLSMAKNYESNGRLNEAKKYYEAILDSYPDTKYTSAAKAALDKLM